MKSAGQFLIVVIVLAWLVSWYAHHDDTDPPGKRSGLELYTDHKTGCQYLNAGSLFGGDVTPRLDSTGRQICSLVASGKGEPK